MTSRCQGLFPPHPFFEGKALGTRLYNNVGVLFKRRVDHTDLLCGYEHFAIISKIATLCFFVLQRDAEVDDAIAGFVQPQILIVRDIFDIDIIYIVAGGGIICQLPQKSILDALLGLLGSFYIFNVSYNQSKAILTFLEQASLEIGRGQTLVTVSSFFNDLASA